MSILRKHHKTGFTTVSNAMLNDSRLSFRARGVLGYLLSKPDGWAVRREVIAADGKEGRDAIRAALIELRECGYYRVRVERGEDGQLRSYTDLFEEPQDPDPGVAEPEPGGEDSPTGGGLPATGSPDTGSPDVGRPATLVSTDSKYLEEVLPPTPAKAGADRKRTTNGNGQAGSCPADPKHANCRGCGTNRRAQARAARTTKPAWCQVCDESSRLRENDAGGMYRCPECHPLALASSA